MYDNFVWLFKIDWQRLLFCEVLSPGYTELCDNITHISCVNIRITVEGVIDLFEQNVKIIALYYL